MEIKELTKEEFEKYPIYKGKHLYVSFVTEEKVTYEGEIYLVMESVSTGKQWVTKDTVIAHMVSFYGIEEPGKPVDSTEWKVSNGDVVLRKSPVLQIRWTLPVGTKYIVAKEVTDNRDWIYPVTLAVRYPDVTYPSI